MPTPQNVGIVTSFSISYYNIWLTELVQRNPFRIEKSNKNRINSQKGCRNLFILWDMSYI